jgi:hypothetical protein
MNNFENYGYMVYTFKHRQAVKFVRDQLFPEGNAERLPFREVTEERVRFHDLDKQFLYTIIPKKKASLYHKITASHHMGEHKKDAAYDDMIEAILDYESAGYTKPDKPLNAFDTISNADWITPELKERLLDVCRVLGIDHSYRNTPDDPIWIEYEKTCKPVTMENIICEIYDYLTHEKHNVLNNIRDIYSCKYLTPELIENIIDMEIKRIREGVILF